jgi:hypothetical protein
MRKLRIRINWQRLKDKMSKEEGRPLDDHHVRQWLLDGGFRPQADGTWLVNEPDLGQLQPEEVESADDVDPAEGS